MFRLASLAALLLVAGSASASRQLLGTPATIPAFKRFIAVGAQGFTPATSNLDIVPVTTGWAIDTDLPFTQVNRTVNQTFPVGYTGATVVNVPAKISKWERLDLQGNQAVTLGRAGNLKADGTCVNNFTIASNKRLLLSTKGASDITINCFQAPATTRLVLSVDGSSVTFADTYNFIHELRVAAVKGKSRVTINGEDTIDVKRLNIREVRGELLLDVRKPSTQINWNITRGFGGELWVKTAGVCPLSSSTGAFTGPNIGNSRYCCGAEIDLDNKVCSGLVVKAGKWD